MEALSDHTIIFSGLKDGAHSFRFELAAAFFQACGMEEYRGGQVRADVALEKSAQLLVARIHVEGHVDMLCDHCNAPLQQPVQGDQRQIFKLTLENETDEDELVSIDPGAHAINLTHYLFECISLHLPIRHVHPEGACDPEVAEALEKVQLNHEPDPRWAALNHLKNKSA